MSNETVNATPVTETPTDATLNRIKTELRDAGEVGKKQWQEAFTRTRDVVSAGSEHATKLAGRAREVLDQVYARAEQRGADLLLRLVKQVRSGAESFEASLRERARSKPTTDAANVSGEGSAATA